MEKNKAGTKKVGIIAFLVFMAVGILIFVNYRTYQKAVFNTGGGKSLAVTGELEAVSKDKTTVYYVEDMLIEAYQKAITVRTMDGKLTWEHIFPTDIVKIVPLKGYILLLEENKQLTCMSRNEETKWHCKLNMEVSDILVDENGNLLIEYKGTEYKKADVFSIKGMGLGSIPMANAYAVAFSVGVDDRFSIAVLDVSSESVKSKVITYGYKGEILWANNFENEIITSISYTNASGNKADDLIIAGEKTLYKFNKNGKQVKKVNLGGSINNIALGSQMAAAVVRDRGRFVAKSYDTDLKEKGTLKLEKAPDGICVQKDLYVLFDREGLTGVNLKGEIVTSYKPETDITNLYISSSDKLYIVSTRKLQRLEFQ